MFASVQSELGSVAGLRVLDLYAGSGALGLEALSRGADYALFVESDRRAAGTVRRNLSALRLGRGEVRQEKAQRVLATAADDPFDLIVADPPYTVADTELIRILELARDNGWRTLDALVVLERSSRGPEFGWPAGYEPLKAKRYGEATLWYGRAAGSAGSASTLGSTDNTDGR